MPVPFRRAHDGDDEWPAAQGDNVHDWLKNNLVQSLTIRIS